MDTVTERTRSLSQSRHGSSCACVWTSPRISWCKEGEWRRWPPRCEITPTGTARRGLWPEHTDAAAARTAILLASSAGVTHQRTRTAITITIELADEEKYNLFQFLHSCTCTGSCILQTILAKGKPSALSAAYVYVCACVCVYFAQKMTTHAYNYAQTGRAQRQRYNIINKQYTNTNVNMYIYI